MCSFQVEQPARLRAKLYLFCIFIFYDKYGNMETAVITAHKIENFKCLIAFIIY